MKNPILKCFGIFLFVTISSFAQERREIDNSINRISSEIYQYSQEVTSFLQISQIEGFGNFNIPQNTRNIAIIRQVGAGNSVSTQTNSQSSDLRYLQVGLNNNIESINSINNLSERVIQLGVNNELLHESFGNINSSTFNVIQTGNNLNLQKIGSNAQTQDMTVRMLGRDRTVIVRSN